VSSAWHRTTIIGVVVIITQTVIAVGVYLSLALSLLGGAAGHVRLHLLSVITQHTII